MCNKFQNITVIAFVLAVGTGTANAATLVTNGSFEDVTNFVDNTRTYLKIADRARSAINVG
jgi:hypothetical protein